MAAEHTSGCLPGSRVSLPYGRGQWSSHLFVIDDLDEYARAVGIVHDEERTGLAQHGHDVSWSVSPHESKPQGAYITIEVRLNCGCQIHDLTAFASHMREQQGWDIATSRGWGGGGSDEGGYSYSMRVRRSSLSGDPRRDPRR
jgi:hypothetical protein